MRYLLFVSVVILFVACSSEKYAYKISNYDGQDHLIKYNTKNNADTIVEATYLNMRGGSRSIYKRKSTYYIYTRCIDTMHRSWVFVSPLNNKLIHKSKSFICWD